MTPSIAGLPRWYLEEQISKFRSGQRGTHPEDMHGQQMRAIVIGLSDVEISEALDVVETLPESKQKLTLGGDVTRGAKLYREYCMECHRFNGKGEVAFKSAPLAGLQDWYLLGQWQKFSSGLRGYHKDDESGPKMQKVTSYLSSDEDVRDIISYISSARN